MRLLQNWYMAQVSAQSLKYDEHQNAILQQLDIFITNFSKQRKCVGWFRRLLGKAVPLGIYIYGDVGRGKSMLMNELFKQLPEQKKTRIHFHQFMNEIHQKLAYLKDHEAPLRIIAKELSQKYRIIFLDEMHVSDIATAMILKNLFEGLFAYKIAIVTSSNYAPDGLYPDGLMRERFLNAIALIKQKLTTLNLNSKIDYRLINNSHNHLFIINHNQSKLELEALFKKFSGDNQVTLDNEILIQNRQIRYVKKSAHIIWFRFDIICGDNRSQLDYLELSKQFEYIIIDGIKSITAEQKDIARRLTWLVDILYDNHKKIILSAACGIGQIYPHGEWAIEFGRTISRLIEMQTEEYLTKQSLGNIAL